MSRRAAYIEHTVRECQDATLGALVMIRKRLIDAANKLLDDSSIASTLAASKIVRETFPPIDRVTDVSDDERIPDLDDLTDEQLYQLRDLRDALRSENAAKNQ